MGSRIYNTRSNARNSAFRRSCSSTTTTTSEDAHGCYPITMMRSAGQKCNETSQTDCLFAQCQNEMQCRKKRQNQTIYRLSLIILAITGITTLFLYVTRSQHRLNAEFEERNAALQHRITELERRLREKFGNSSVERPDFALATIGGRILKTSESEAFQTFLGFRLCDEKPGPSSMIRPNNAPGECWAFKGSTGWATIQLVGLVRIDGVTLEHIALSQSPSGNLFTAPKDFNIWGIKNLDDDKRRLLGTFTYSIRAGGERVQTFPINNTLYFEYIDFEVLSNHGNQDYTCVYRLQVHGTLK